MIDLDKWNELTVLERARYVYQTNKKLQRKYPELKHGGSRKGENAAAALVHARIYKVALLKKAGMSLRAWQRASFLWQNLSNPTRERVKGTWLANNQSELMQLAAYGRKKQARILEVLFDVKTPPKNVTQTLEFIETGKLQSREQRAILKALKMFKTMPDPVFDVVMHHELKRVKKWAEEQMNLR